MRKTIAYLLTVFVLTGLMAGCGADREEKTVVKMPEKVWPWDLF